MKQKISFESILAWAVKTALVFVVMFTVLSPQMALAQQKQYDTNASNQNVKQEEATGIVQCGNRESDPCTVEDVFNVFVIMTNLLIGMAGIIAIISIIYAGFSMVQAAGNQEGITAGKKRLANSILGLILVFMSFMIINTILGKTFGIGVFGGTELLGNPCKYVNPDGADCPKNP